MNSETLANLPADVDEAIQGEVDIDESIPDDLVEIRPTKVKPIKKRSQPKRITSQIFVREIRKRERQNKKAARRAKYS